MRACRTVHKYLSALGEGVWVVSFLPRGFTRRLFVVSLAATTCQALRAVSDRVSCGLERERVEGLFCEGTGKPANDASVRSPPSALSLARAATLTGCTIIRLVSCVLPVSYFYYYSHLPQSRCLYSPSRAPNVSFRLVILFLSSWLQTGFEKRSSVVFFYQVP